ncbi:hypothetical protein AVEN_31921-1 [Araneus ventricosus]|uniref:Uncharacterized protein n=1 Tax=Araneus ventricosus TaxID=182803 RepID=A0A4Y2M2A1_ARAVE|nr:hypothetical protein AVEN_31921-1 [Araneus ventricosus]
MPQEDITRGRMTHTHRKQERLLVLSPYDLHGSSPMLVADVPCPFPAPSIVGSVRALAPPLQASARPKFSVLQARIHGKSPGNRISSLEPSAAEAKTLPLDHHVLQ